MHPDGAKEDHVEASGIQAANEPAFSALADAAESGDSELNDRRSISSFRNSSVTGILN
jgi:hypothetical protein